MTDFQKEALAALKLAANINPFGSVENVEAREAARRVIAKMDREPVAWINWSALTGKPRLGWECESELASEPLYRDPPARYSDIESKGGMDPRDHKPWCASLSSLNIKPQPCDCVRVPLPTTPGSATRSADSAESFCKSKPWVRLTEAEVDRCWRMLPLDTRNNRHMFAGLIQAKLREKNT